MPNSRESILMNGFSIGDELGIVYLVENAQQFWSELEDLLTIPKDKIPTLEQLDGTLKRYVGFCACYHEQYLQSPLQLEHACNTILDSELFAFHSERMCEILTNEAQSNTNPHFQLICYHILLLYGARRNDFFRSHKRWHSLLPFLMDHVLVEIDSDVEDTYFGISGSSNGSANVPVPIEAKLRSLSVRLLYEVCRVQKFSVADLRVFDDGFIDYLFDLVEQTRHMQDDSFNYSVIKLIVALNEQFMVASLGNGASQNDGGISYKADSDTASSNRVLRVLMRRLNTSKTFGENMIFMLNRAQRSPEDLCMQLLVLKLLYLLFTTKGTSEYFYTNDLCVLVDVFLREIVDLDEDSESLRHTYLRVLHPLLTKTQLRDVPYKRPQILYALESLGGIRDARSGYSGGRDVNPTTKRLVERCLGGEWCVQLKRVNAANDDDASSESSQARSHLGLPSSADLDSKKAKGLKSSKSMEFQKHKNGAAHSSSAVSAHTTTTFAQQQAAPVRSTYSPQPHSPRSPPPRSPLSHVAVSSAAQRRPSNSSVYSTSSALSLHGVANATVTGSVIDGIPLTSNDPLHSPTSPLGPGIKVPTPLRKGSTGSEPVPHHHSASNLPDTVNSLTKGQEPPKQRRSAPAPPGPPKRRKPPAIPVRTGANGSNGKVTITAIKSSASGG
ncbi:hypothetical protein WG66_001388 [Moniliophthora roreri]|uniref:SPIN90/Ldb17 leucine-rich domain-containing protein n=1 Tax=Moniliophthora roreri TaxID=221103 RepID=A0A0W0F0X4_MONRR|nr:hypothetical protein WG66_001388 [Moniliophthora roreri]